MESNKIIDVLIVGAGPTGTSLAIDLVRRGLDVRIIDKAPHAFQGSRAKGIQPRTLEVFDDFEVITDILSQGSLYPLLGIHLGPITIPWPMFKNKRATASTPYPNTWLIPQYTTDSALHNQLKKLGRNVDFGRKLIGFTQGLEAVVSRVSFSNGEEEIISRYLVGADGGSSEVRQQLGVNFIGSTDEQDRILIVDAITTGLSRNRWHVWPGRNGKFVGACPLPNSQLFQWMIRLAPEEEPPESLIDINRRIQSHTRNLRIVLKEMKWRSVFRPNIRLAEVYRSKRVFISGDAAHVHTPAGAQGLNTGIQDAYNLGWKLAQVLAGASDDLLDTYEMERRPIAASVLGLSTKKYNGISNLDPSSIRRGKDEQQLTLTYHGGPLASSASDRTNTLESGDRAPDAFLFDSKGKGVRLFDLFRGSHFTLIAYGNRAARDLARINWPVNGAQLKRIVVNSSWILQADYVLNDLKHTFESVYSPPDDTLILIRPDGYIAHISSSEDLNSLYNSIHKMTPNAEFSGERAGESNITNKPFSHERGYRAN
ncbi:FAD-dependent oxidoreductase [Leptospira andrefontaineae]|uniref:FAD-binding monooxygenase n=1 Tax=Leptospira andrefontaineae TaxID=2484976 RepID=A0A4R9GXR1_9LEPT|nr:FAD-dependent oxidoreductase [Leptospira andrefontaineae]TGK36653.1 FAD-binding monooxygenase [Leptospira andrefontaineae]